MLTKRQLLIVAVVVRVSATLFCSSYFVADEYWQSLEIAHRLVFGRGELTWEWHQGIRSFVFPTIIAIPYWLLKILHLDTPFLLQIIPRLLMTALGVVEDWLILNHKGHTNFFACLTSWASLYFGGRTLVDTLESFFVLLFSIHSTTIPLAVIAFWLRPTSLIPSLLFFNFKNLNLKKAFRQILFMASLMCLGDAIFYHILGLNVPLFTPLNFLISNFGKGVAVLYGTQPFLFYFYSALPSILLVLLIPLTKSLHSKNVIIALLNVLLLSLSKHKEIRYIYPSILVILSSLSSLSPSILGVNSVLNLAVFVFLSKFHQAGQTEVARIIAKDPKDTLFLLPCHSTPFTAYIHSNCTLKHLECPHSGYSPSSEFLRNPIHFVQTIQPYTYIAVYTSYAAKIHEWLRENGLVETRRIFNSFFPIDGINNSHISLYEMVN